MLWENNWWTLRFFVLIALYFACAQALAVEPPPDLQKIIKNVAAAERVIRNVEIQNFSLMDQLLPPNSTDWQTTKYSERGTAWYNGLRNSKARIHIADKVSAWNDGPAQWLQQKQDVGYDGQFGRVIEYLSGPLGNPTPDREGLLLPGRPFQLSNRYQAFADGTAFSLNFYRSFGDENQPLSVELQTYYDRLRLLPSPKANALLHISWDNVYGDKVVKIQFGGANAFDAFWLDPTHGWALRRVEQKSTPTPPHGVVYHRLTEVTKITQAAPGIWFPIKASREMPYPLKPGWQQRLIYHAENVIVNNPDFNDSIFTIHFPPHYNITDKIRGGGFTTVSAEQTAAEIDKDVAILKKRGVDSTQVSPTAMANAPGTLASKTVAEVPPNRPMTIYVVIGVLALLGILGIGWVIIRQRGRHVGVFWIVLLMPLVVARQGQSAVKPSETHTVSVRSNCGINVAYLGLKWFGKNADFAALSQTFGINDVHDPFLSLADIKHVWESNGISVKGYETNGGIAQIIQTIPPAGLAVVRLARISGGTDVGHFIVLIPDAKGINVIDPPNAVNHLTVDQATADRDLATCAREFVVATPPSATTGPRFYAASTIVEMGRIPIGTDDFAGEFVYENHGGQALKILHAHKSCSCMQPPTGDFQVEPGGRVTISLTFMRSKVTGGLNQRSLLLETNDPAHKKVLVVFKFDLAEAPKPLEANILPRAVDYGRATAGDILKNDIEIEVDIPVKIEAKTIPAIQVTASTPDLKIGPITNADDQEPLAITGGASLTSGQRGVKPAMELKAVEFKVHWLRAPKGLFNAELRVDISGTKPSTMKVPIRGECIPG